jgi:cytochrome c oxidase subunit 1
MFSGLYYWFPKVTGRFLSEKLGAWHFWTTLIGFNLTFFPMHFSGMFGQPRRTWTYQSELGIELFNQLSTIGGFILGVSTLIMLWNVLKSARSGTPAGSNPWGAPSLEWSIPSPPHHYNFPGLPEVRSREPMWHDDERAAIEAVTLAEPETEPEMPGPSFWPIVVASGVTATWALVMTGVWWMPLVGLAYTGFGVYMWAFEDPFKHLKSSH